MSEINKSAYKVTLEFLKVIPMLLALCDLLNTATCLLGYPIDLFSYLGGVSVLTLAFLYLVSYVFQFCIYHRMFLHYILANNLLSCVEYYIGFPTTTNGLITIFVINTGIFLFLILYFRRKVILCCSS